MLGSDGFLTVPTAPGPAPLLNTPPEELNVFRGQLISVTCIASLCQLPQVGRVGVQPVECCVGGWEACMYASVLLVTLYVLQTQGLLFTS